MPIPREYQTSNPVVRDALALIPIVRGTKVGDFVMPDFPVDAEVVDDVTTFEHALNLDDLRAPDAEAKSIRFETGSVATISIVERAQKSTMDSRKIEEAGNRGVDLVAQRADLHRSDILDAKEYRIAQLAMTAGNFGATHKDTSGLDFSAVDLLGYFDKWREVCLTDGGFDPQYATFGRKALRAARKNAAFQKFAAGAQIGAGGLDLTLRTLAEFLGLSEIRLADFSRRVGAVGNAPTQFWDSQSVLLFAKQNSVSNRTFGVTPVTPYGQAQGAAPGTTVDVRTAALSGTERLTEVGAYHRYKSIIANSNLGFLVTGIVGFQA